MNATNYEAYLRSSGWSEKKRKFRQNKFGSKTPKCEICKLRGANFHVHHCSYERLGHESYSDLVELCPVCHCVTHKAVDRGGYSLRHAHRRLTDQWHAHASSNKLWKLKETNPYKYSIEVLKFFNLSPDEPFIAEFMAYLQDLPPVATRAKPAAVLEFQDESRCELCRFWVAPVDGQGEGQCRRFPTDYRSPVLTRKFDWCGEFRRNK